jgi:hypothetical protein
MLCLPSLEKLRQNRKEKREESHKREARSRNLDSQSRRVVLRNRFCKRKHPMVGWNFRYLQESYDSLCQKRKALGYYNQASLIHLAIGSRRN